MDTENGDVFVANSGSNNLSEISATTDRVIASGPVGTLPLPPAFDSLTDELYVPVGGQSTVTVVSGSTFAIVATVPAGGLPGVPVYDPWTVTSTPPTWARTMGASSRSRTTP
jgi:YVTN family beta-propeller protein